jgi:hypothetical protein
LHLVPKGTANELMKEHNRVRTENKKFREQDLADAQAAVVAARARFQDALVKAKGAGGDIGAGGDFKTYPDPVKLRRAFDEVKGGFSTASAQGQFGYGSQAKEDTELLKAIRDNAKKTAEEVAHLVLALNLR